MRALIVSWDGGGNVPPMIGLGRHLLGAGHEVSVLGTPTLAERVAHAGLEFRALSAESTWVPRSDAAIEDDPVSFAVHLAGADLARETLTAIDASSPDLLVVDCMAGGGLCASEVSELPTAVLVHMRYSYFATGAGAARWVPRPLIDATRAELGLEPVPERASLWPWLWGQAERTLVASIIELDPDLDVTAEVVHVGPITDRPEGTAAVDLVEGDDRPVVLVSHSTTYMGQQGVLQRTLDALANSDLRVVVTLGHSLDPARLQIPGNARLYQWLDHHSVMAQVSAVVTHGGHGTVLTALTAGVPMVCLPAGRDQAENADVVAKLGAGRTLPQDSGPEEIRNAVRAVLSDPGYRTASQELAGAISRYGGGQRAVEELSTIVGTSRGVG